MVALPRITVEHLLNTYLSFPDDIRNISPTFHIGLAVVKYFLGEDWIERHLNPLTTLEPSFMRLKLGDDAATYIQTFKTVDLGELLFNLQDVEGFDECISRMQNEEHVEASLAELDFGRMLKVNRHKFKFVVPRSKRGDNYDFEITLDRWVLCADVKCKLDDKEFRERMITNVLKESRDQLPRDRPGVFFIKVPQHWMEVEEFDRILVETANKFLSSTGRIVSVKYYIAPYAVQNGLLTQGHHFKEIANPRNRFDAGRKWELFTFHNPPPRTRDASGETLINALPPNWRRFIDFPNVLLRMPP